MKETRSTQIAQTTAERQHNRIAEWIFAMQISYAAVGALKLQVMEFGSKGGWICKYWKLGVMETWWNLQAMEFSSKGNIVEFASNGS